MEYIYDHPGTSAQEMVECIRVDKVTLTKVIKKLDEIGYIRIVRSEDDRRIRRLYLTDKAVPAPSGLRRYITVFIIPCALGLHRRIFSAQNRSWSR